MSYGGIGASNLFGYVNVGSWRRSARQDARWTGRVNDARVLHVDCHYYALCRRYSAVNMFKCIFIDGLAAN